MCWRNCKEAILVAEGAREKAARDEVREGERGSLDLQGSVGGCEGWLLV